MSHTQTGRELEQLFKSVANKRRVVILRYLDRKGASSVGAIAEHIKISLSATSRHLDILERSGFLDERQESLTVFYSINQQCNGDTKTLLRIIL